MSEKAKGALTRADGQLVNKMELSADYEAMAHTAHQLRVAGHPWHVVAKQVGYANAKTAQVEVTAYLQRAALESEADRRQQALDLELERIDTLISSYWNAAIAGDVKAAEFCLKAIQTQARLLRLEEPQAITATKTIVISGTTEDYAHQLQRFVEEQT